MRRRSYFGTRQVVVLFFLLVVTSIVSVFLLSYVRRYKNVLDSIQTLSIEIEKVRELKVSDQVLAYYLDGDGRKEKDMIEELTIAMILNDYELTDIAEAKNDDVSEKFRNMLCEKEEYKKLYQIYKAILSDNAYFPVPVDLSNKESVAFEDSWGGLRNFGGDRRHEGCDIMTSNNKRGYFPIVSISDGVVENKGWLKLGGYRIGIRSTNGCYYYYAHLYSYAEELEIGDNVTKGQLLGFMGDTGYGEKEGTTGMFDVHLHLGMYVSFENKDISVNPYVILRYLERHKLAYYF